MTRARITSAVLLVLLGAGLLIRVTNRPEEQPKKSKPVPVATGMVEGPADIVDSKTGSIHLQIPIRAVRQKTAAPRSGH